MVSSISGSGSSEIQKLMLEMMKKMSSADTDGTRGLSKSELSSIDTSGDEGGEGFLSMLSSNFDKIDTDKNGQLSQNEISSVKPPKGPMGPPPGMSIEDLFSNDTDGTEGLSKDELSSIEKGDVKGAGNFIENLTDSFDKIDTNKDGQISQEELEAAKPPEPLNGGKGNGRVPIFENAEAGSSGSSANFGNTFGKLSDFFLKQLASAYKSGELSNLVSKAASAVNVAI